MPTRSTRTLAALGAALLLSACLNQVQSDAATSAARKTPSFSECVNGKELDSLNNCAEYCSRKGKGCQQYGCPHPTDKSSQFGGLSYSGSFCSEAPQRAFQCNEPFQGEVGVRCCCVAQ